MHLKRLLLPTIVALGIIAVPLAGWAQVTTSSVSSGDLIKIVDDGDPNTDADKAVYYLGENGKRYVFPNERTYFTWYSDFTTVKSVSAATMSSFPLGGNATYRPGLRMVKIQTDPKTYAVTRGGILRWVKTEAVALALYGQNWNQMIDDVPDTFFIDYKTGADINAASEYGKDLMRDASPTINSDKQMTAPSGTVVDVRGSGFTPATKGTARNGSLTWINLTNDLVRVASDPHPTHTTLPSFESGDLGLGAEYTYTFTQNGTWNYHDHWSPGHSGSVTVQ